MKVLLGIHKWKFLPFPSTFGCTKYMHSRVNICSTHIYPIPTSFSNHAGWQKIISHILALGDPPVKLTIDSIMQWRYHIKNMQWSYPIKSMLGEEKRKHWTLWGSKRRQHNGINVGGFSEPCDPGDEEVSTGWWMGRAALWASYLGLNQVNSISICLIYWEFKWKVLQKKRLI